MNSSFKHRVGWGEVGGVNLLRDKKKSRCIATQVMTKNLEKCKDLLVSPLVIHYIVCRLGKNFLCIWNTEL